MKIRIDDEYSDLEGGFNIVVNEHSQNHEGAQSQDEFKNCREYNGKNKYSEDGNYTESFGEKHREYDEYYSLENEASESYMNNYNETYEGIGNDCICGKGEISASVRLDNKNGVEIKGAKVNLYSLNGVCPKLHESKLTDCNGEVIFSCLENGCYRVISIVDRRYFEKPIYTNWNEVTIDNCIKDANVGIINKIKQSCYKR